MVAMLMLASFSPKPHKPTQSIISPTVLSSEKKANLRHPQGLPISHPQSRKIEAL